MPHPRSSKRAFKIFWVKSSRTLMVFAALSIATVLTCGICQFITGDLQTNVLVILSIISTVLLLWSLRNAARYRIKFVNTFMVLLFSGLFIVASTIYLDIRSPQDIKANIVSAFSLERGQFRATVDLIIQRVDLKVTAEVKETAEVEEMALSPDTQHVILNGGLLIGADDHLIALENNPEAADVSWEELKAFLFKDNTDMLEYDFDSFVCADFAEMLHNNAEVAGIRAAYVSVILGPCDYFPTTGGHALNAFEATDKGLVYIDCTSANLGINSDKIVELKVGRQYIPKSIFPEPGWSSTYDSMGELLEIEDIQW